MTTYNFRNRLLLALVTLIFMGTSIASAQDASTNSKTNTDNKTNTMVTLSTSAGDITLELDAEKAPKTVANFLEYANAGFYDGTIFHRVIAGFMVQGGGFTEQMNQKPTRSPVPNEADNGLQNLKYTVAMARTPDPHSATAQFFINVSDNSFLNFKSTQPDEYGYAVFGKVVAGEDVVDAMEQVRTGRVGPHGDVPLEPIMINSVSVAE